LGGIASGLRNPRRRAVLTLSRVEEHFMREGLGPSDIEVFMNTVERDLRTLGINVCPTPQYKEHLGVDEPALEGLLQAEVGYQNQHARQHDLDALTAVWRLRHGQAQRRLETCQAIFVTTNAPLVRAARRFFAAGCDGFTWPLAILDHDLATVAWLKRPLQAPDLPRKQIVADCYAALRPEGRLWARYLEEIEALRQRGELSNDHFVALRYSVDARRALMDATLGDPEAISGTTVQAVLNATLDSIKSPLLEQIAAREAAQEATEREAQAAAGRADAAEQQATQALQQVAQTNAMLSAFQQAQVNRAKRKAARWGRRLELLAFAVLAVLVAGSAFATLASSIPLPGVVIPPSLRWPGRILFIGLLVVGAIFSAVSLMTGWSVTKEYGSSWIFEPCLTWANALRRVQHPGFSLVSPGCRSSRTGSLLDSRRTTWMSSPPRGLPTKARDCSVSSTALPPCTEAGQLIHGATLRSLRSAPRTPGASLRRPGPRRPRRQAREHVIERARGQVWAALSAVTTRT